LSTSFPPRDALLPLVAVQNHVELPVVAVFTLIETF
jgi:hypothetical protein